MAATAKQTPPKLTKRERAVAIAKDVIRQLRWLRVAQYHYLNVQDSDKIESAIDKVGYDADLRDILPVVRKNCDVCAKAAMLLSKARVFDKVPISEVFSSWGSSIADDDEICSLLSGSFSSKTLSLIEAAFERSRMFAGYTPESIAAEEFGDRYPDPKKRLRAIMLNVVKNNGEFKP